jgi:hypothetical protein
MRDKVYNLSLNNGAIFKPKPSIYSIALGFSLTAAFLNITSLFVDSLQFFWASPYIIILLIAITVYFNSKILFGHLLSWINIFLIILSIFHLGYYIPAKVGLIAELNYMPSLDDPYVPLSLTLFVMAFLFFEIGALLTFGLKNKRGRLNINPALPKYSDFRAIFFLGILVTIVSLVLLIYYIIQIGGINIAFAINYTEYVLFVSSSDPRFASISIAYFPIGLLLMCIYVFRVDAPHKKFITTLIVSLCVLFISWLLWLGIRGAAFISLISFLYFYNALKKPINIRKVTIYFILALFSIPLIRDMRNLGISERNIAFKSISLSPLEGLSELGGIFRPYLGLISYYDAGNLPKLGVKPYLIALTRVIPNIGSYSTEIKNLDYYRTNIWITELLAPGSTSLNIGLGSSGIGEPFACFGPTGIIILFFILGSVIVSLELRLVYSAYSCALTAFLFFPINWYIRDDIFGTLRTIIWGLAAVAITYIISRKKIK